MHFTQTETILLILISVALFYIIYDIANLPVYQYSQSKNIPLKIKPTIINEQKLELIKQKSICETGRPRCDIYQSNTESYSNCMNDLADFIECGCNTNQFSLQ